MTYTLRLQTAALLVAAAAAAAAMAGPGPNYGYGEAWWEEYASDSRTALLLPFGRPQERPAVQLAEAVATERKESDLLTLDGLEQAATGLGAPDPKRLASGPGPINDQAVPPGLVLDYSDRRQRLSLPPGMSVGPDGRFGDGLLLAGGPGLRVRVIEPRQAEAFFKIDAYPAAEACLLSLAEDEAKVMLLPDGRLELRLRKPHGIPDPERNTPEQIAAILKKDASIISPDPVPLGRWTHVAVRNQAHPMPGGGEPFDARLMVNGDDVAWYMSERYNRYWNYFGRQDSILHIGNAAAGDAPFVGSMDQVRVSSVERQLYSRPELPWRDTAAAREPLFNTPWFRNDAAIFHLPFDKGLAFARGPAGVSGAELKLAVGDAAALQVDGIRGRALLLDPLVGFPRVPLAGMRFDAGALEFWLRPVNFDDVTGYWHHSPPGRKDLSAVRLTARNPAGATVPWLTFTLERAHNIERGRLPLDPGHWMHVMMVWKTRADGTRDAWAWLDGSPRGVGVRFDRDARTAKGLEPAFAEFGITDDITVKRGEPPRLEIDEVCGYAAAFEADEAAVAYKRWQGAVEPVPLCQTDHQYKFSLHRVTFTVRPLLPEALQPASVDLVVTDASGAAVAGPFTERAADAAGRYRFLVSDGKPVAAGAYRYAYTVRDAAGKALTEGAYTWKYAEEPWRHNRAGIVDKPYPPWTDVQVSGRVIDTRMTRYTLGADGLPAQIRADGVDLLAAPVRLIEDGKPLAGALRGEVRAIPVEAAWSAAFSGVGTDAALACVTEFDGMTRFELKLTGKGPALPLQLVIPIKAAHTTHGYQYPMGARGVSTFSVGAADGTVLDSRSAGHGSAGWRAYAEKRKSDPALDWQVFWKEYEKGVTGYGFLGHLGLNDLNRGLLWFCDNAAGWRQSPTVGAIQVVRAGDTVSIVLNLIPEPGKAYDDARPIIFGLLPHPARPLPPKYRVYNKNRPDLDPLLCDIYDAFQPWPANPRSHEMAIYPGSDPKTPGAGPSWEYAESCIPSMRSIKHKGLRTFYLSKVWFSCRAGAYDGWEWRNGASGAVSLTPWFVNYLCWEMDEWIGRGIWDAIYLDECYETAARNLDAGFSVTLPDGSEQPGTRNFDFRELMKRWRGIFVQHGKDPMVIGHHTYSWKYPGMVFCDSSLDGENAPIVSLNSRDWIESTSKERYEVLQNGRLWGVATFYMPFIAEGGFDNKEKSQFLRWQWRMARQAQSQFAHYETATVYEGQGSQVYKAFWNDVFAWGGADETVATFHPYWDNADGVAVEGQGNDVLVSYYKRPGSALLIVSNRKNTDTVIPVRLLAAGLGLAGAPRTVTVRDSGYPPAKGDDFVRGDKPKLDGPEGLPRLDGDPADDLLMQTLHAVTSEKVFDDRITLAGDTVTVPVRPRDFRMFVVE